MKLLSLLQTARHHHASDLHIVVGVPPIFRKDGQIVTAKGDSITPETARTLAYELLNDEQRSKFDRDLALCFSTRFGKDEDRARVALYFRNGIPEMSIRLSEKHIRNREELGLPKIVEELARKPNGLVLITGPTGTGKTTTFHYMVDLINVEYRRKIVTIEDPIEFTHMYKRSIVIQQEVLTDVLDFNSALKHVLRQDPDVICIGEMRDPETIYTALMAAETGHLVIATLHTPGAAEVIQRISSAFPEGQQDEVRFMLANVLQGVISQQLIPRANGDGRIVACEVLVGTPGVRKQVRDNESHRLYSEMQAGGKYDMTTMDRSLLKLYQQGDISYDTAVSLARYPEQITKRSA